MTMNNKYNWVIGICDSGTEGISFRRVYATEEDAKAYLFKLIEEDRKAHEEDGYDELDFGTETLEEIQNDGPGRWYGYNCYLYSHVDFSLENEENIYVLPIRSLLLKHTANKKTQ